MNVLLLAPKNTRDGGPLANLRAELAHPLTAAGHRPIILENEENESGETLRHKFLRLASECQQAVLIWPPAAAMATTADELILLQEAYERHPLRIVLILHESEVEERDHELHVHFPADQSRYLDGILTCNPYFLWWPINSPFQNIVDRYVDEYL
jgi:hypothetical protein